jgi:hypothetical protein
MKIDAYRKTLLTIMVLCLVFITIKYLIDDGVKTEASITLLPAEPKAPVASLPSERNPAGFTGSP